MKKTAMSDAGMIYLDFITSSLRACLVRQSSGYIARAANKGKKIFERPSGIFSRPVRAD